VPDPDLPPAHSLTPERLLAKPRREFDQLVYVTAVSRDTTAAHADALRHPAVVEHTLSALNRQYAVWVHKQSEAKARGDRQAFATAGRIVTILEVEKRAVRPLAVHAREQRLAAQDASERGVVQEAYQELSKLHPDDFRHLKRQIRERRRAAGTDREGV
jgi:hypothetical protein